MESSDGPAATCVLKAAEDLGVVNVPNTTVMSIGGNDLKGSDLYRRIGTGPRQ